MDCGAVLGTRGGADCFDSCRFVKNPMPRLSAISRCLPVSRRFSRRPRIEAGDRALGLQQPSYRLRTLMATP